VQTSDREIAMLSVTSYEPDHIAACRATIDRHLAAWRELAAAVRDGDGVTALAAFEPSYFNALLLVLDECFLHRARGLERKDGNPMNEVRALCTALVGGGGVLATEKQVKLRPDRSVLGLAAGDPIAIRESDFVRLADGYFAEIEATYGAAPAPAG
jgi:hypothetical protein